MVNKSLDAFHINKSGIRRLLAYLFSNKLNGVSPNSVILEDSMDVDLAALRRQSPSHQYSSSLCVNEFTEEYDLQIIVPVYKVELYIEACMKSIINQKTKYRFIVVVVNDGSPDQSREKLTKYEKYDNIIIIDQKNRGHSGARNRGLEHIRARYVTFVDSDDELQTGAIEVLLDTAYSTGADIVEGGYDILYHGKRNVGLRHEEKITNTWLGVLAGYPWGKVFRSTLFKNVHFPEGYWFEDTLMCFLIYPLAQIFSTIQDSVYIYRINPQGISATSKGNPKSLDSIFITIQLLEDAMELGMPIDHQRYDMFLRQSLVNYMRILSLHDEQLNRHVFALHTRLRNQYFKECRTMDKTLIPFEESLLSLDYGSYTVNALIRQVKEL